MAVCGVLTALTVVLMALGGAVGVLTYACPMAAGVIALFLRREYGLRYALAFWGAAGLLSFMLVPDLEMTALFVGLLGWYPAVKPGMDRLPRWPRRLAKAALFNGAVLAVYAALLVLMGLTALGLGGWVENGALLLAGNLLFALYDRVLDRLAETLFPRLRRLLPRD